MNAPAKLSEVSLKTVEFTLDQKTIHAFEGETILKAAKRHGVDIPHLCYKDGYRADGNCRACMVEIDGERVLAASCCRAPTAGMKVVTDSARAVASQKMVLELLLIIYLCLHLHLLLHLCLHLLHSYPNAYQVFLVAWLQFQ